VGFGFSISTSLFASLFTDSCAGPENK
jgi:hypothetical protein